LNHVYFDKRRLYLAAIAKALNDSGLVSSVEASDFKQDFRKPFLIVKPNYKTKFTARIFVAAPVKSFKLSQLRHTKNNVRPLKWLEKLAASNGSGSGTNGSGAVKAMDASTLSGTPGYNMAILEDIVVVLQHKLLSSAVSACSCFRDACILLKVDRQVEIMLM
jgi:hypothetical protein